MLLDSIIGTEEFFFISGIVLFLLILAVVVKLKTKSKPSLESMLKPLSKGEIKHIVIPDGIGGLLEINQIILLDQGLLLIEAIVSDGNVFGGEDLDEWTQISKGRSFKFANPLRRLKTAKQALSTLVPGVPIFYHLVFSDETVFPRGKPNSVSVLHSLQSDLAYLQNEPVMMKKSKQAWERILRIARIDGHAVLMDKE